MPICGGDPDGNGRDRRERTSVKYGEGEGTTGKVSMGLSNAVSQDSIYEGFPFTFVTDGVERAVEQAKEVAGEKDVAVGAASIVQQCIRAGLLDEIRMDIAPVLPGGGVRLLEHLGVVSHRVGGHPGDRRCRTHAPHLPRRAVKKGERRCYSKKNAITTEGGGRIGGAVLPTFACSRTGNQGRAKRTGFRAGRMGSGPGGQHPGLARVQGGARVRKRTDTETGIRVERKRCP